MNHGIDWSHKYDQVMVSSNGDTTKGNWSVIYSKVSKGDRICIEDPPINYIFPFLEKEVRVFRIQGLKVAKNRTLNDIEKTDENDAKMCLDLLDTSDVYEITSDDPDVKTIFAYKEYKDCTELSKQLKNRAFAAESYQNNRKAKQYRAVAHEIDLEKNKIARRWTREHLKEKNVLCSIPGIGIGIALQICGSCDPRRFPAYQAYLKYIGLFPRDKLKTFNGKRRKVPKGALFHVIIESCIKNKNVYYDVYKKWKEKFILDGYDRGIAHRKALNRTKTKLAIDIWKAFR